MCFSQLPVGGDLGALAADVMTPPAAKDDPIWQEAFIRALGKLGTEDLGRDQTCKEAYEVV
jgi:hypothetical protein